MKQIYFLPVLNVLRIYLGEKIRRFFSVISQEIWEKINLIYAKKKISKQYLLLTENMYGNKVDGFPKSNSSQFPAQTKSFEKKIAKFTKTI